MLNRDKINIYIGTNSLPFFKIYFYNLDVSTGNNPFRHGQLNTMISLDVRNSYALWRAADAPELVGQTQRRYTHLQVDDVRDEMLNIAQMENNMIMQESLKTMELENNEEEELFNF